PIREAARGQERAQPAGALPDVNAYRHQGDKRENQGEMSDDEGDAALPARRSALGWAVGDVDEPGRDVQQDDEIEAEGAEERARAKAGSSGSSPLRRASVHWSRVSCTRKRA